MRGAPAVVAARLGQDVVEAAVRQRADASAAGARRQRQRSSARAEDERRASGRAGSAACRGQPTEQRVTVRARAACYDARESPCPTGRCPRRLAAAARRVRRPTQPATAASAWRHPGDSACRSRRRAPRRPSRPARRRRSRRSSRSRSSPASRTSRRRSPSTSCRRSPPTGGSSCRAAWRSSRPADASRTTASRRR